MSKVWAFPFTFNVTLLILRSPYAQANDYERSEYGLDLQLFAEIEWITRINASSPETREPLPLRISNECRRRDSNPHASRRHPLKMVCLPIPPLRQSLYFFSGVAGVAGAFCWAGGCWAGCCCAGACCCCCCWPGAGCCCCGWPGTGCCCCG